MQKNLFPVEVDTEIPPLDSTADCKYYCRGIDSNIYAVKQTSDNPDYPSAPFDELFGYELARAVNIAVPQYNLIKIPFSPWLGFGSVCEGGVIPDGFRLHFSNIIQNQTNASYKELFLKKVSSIYALDLFLCNEDRHPGNYLIKDTMGHHVIMGIDFGRSWTGLDCPVDRNGSTSPFSNRLPFYYLKPLLAPKSMTPSSRLQPIVQEKPKKTNTYNIASIIWSRDSLGPLHGGSFFEVLTKIEEMTVSDIQTILNQVPDEWCPPCRKQGIADWWDSEERIKRINKIKLGYQHGTLV